MAKPLAIIPTYVRQLTDVQMLETTLKSLRETAGEGCDVMVVDDGSPERDLVKAITTHCEAFGAQCVAKEENEGFAKTVNVGLRKCLLEERDAILVNSDIEFGLTRDWLGLMQRQQSESRDGLASVVGALLLYPTGLIQHGGIYFSLLTRDFNHRYHFGPGDLPEAQVATTCPVTGALQFIRHETLKEVGLYDETFRLGWEDVDYCVRVLLSGRDCVYQPGVRAIHHESAFRGGHRADDKIRRWTQDSWMRFVAKYANTNFAALVPNMLGG